MSVPCCVFCLSFFFLLLSRAADGSDATFTVSSTFSLTASAYDQNVVIYIAKPAPPTPPPKGGPPPPPPPVSPVRLTIRQNVFKGDLTIVGYPTTSPQFLASESIDISENQIFGKISIETLNCTSTLSTSSPSFVQIFKNTVKLGVQFLKVVCARETASEVAVERNTISHTGFPSTDASVLQCISCSFAHDSLFSIRDNALSLVDQNNGQGVGRAFGVLFISSTFSNSSTLRLSNNTVNVNGGHTVLGLAGALACGICIWSTNVFDGTSRFVFDATNLVTVAPLGSSVPYYGAQLHFHHPMSRINAKELLLQTNATLASFVRSATTDAPVDLRLLLLSSSQSAESTIWPTREIYFPISLPTSFLISLHFLVDGRVMSYNPFSSTSSCNSAFGQLKIGSDFSSTWRSHIASSLTLSGFCFEEVVMRNANYSALQLINVSSETNFLMENSHFSDSVNLLGLQVHATTTQDVFIVRNCSFKGLNPSLRVTGLTLRGSSRALFHGNVISLRTTSPTLRGLCIGSVTIGEGGGVHLLDQSALVLKDNLIETISTGGSYLTGIEFPYGSNTEVSSGAEIVFDNTTVLCKGSQHYQFTGIIATRAYAVVLAGLVPDKISKRFGNVRFVSDSNSFTAIGPIAAVQLVATISAALAQAFLGGPVSWLGIGDMHLTLVDGPDGLESLNLVVKNPDFTRMPSLRLLGPATYGISSSFVFCNPSNSSSGDPKNTTSVTFQNVTLQDLEVGNLGCVDYFSFSQLHVAETAKFHNFATSHTFTIQNSEFKSVTFSEIDIAGSGPNKNLATFIFQDNTVRGFCDTALMFDGGLFTLAKVIFLRSTFVNTLGVVYATCPSSAIVLQGISVQRNSTVVFKGINITLYRHQGKILSGLLFSSTTFDAFSAVSFDGIEADIEASSTISGGQPVLGSAYGIYFDAFSTFQQVTSLQFPDRTSLRLRCIKWRNDPREEVPRIQFQFGSAYTTPIEFVEHVLRSVDWLNGIGSVQLAVSTPLFVAANSNISVWDLRLNGGGLSITMTSKTSIAICPAFIFVGLHIEFLTLAIPCIRSVVILNSVFGATGSVFGGVTFVGPTNFRANSSLYIVDTTLHGKLGITLSRQVQFTQSTFMMRSVAVISNGTSALNFAGASFTETFVSIHDSQLQVFTLESDIGASTTVCSMCFSVEIYSVLYSRILVNSTILSVSIVPVTATGIPSSSTVAKVAINAVYSLATIKLSRIAFLDCIVSANVEPSSEAFLLKRALGAILTAMYIARLDTVDMVLQGTTLVTALAQTQRALQVSVTTNCRVKLLGAHRILDSDSSLLSSSLHPSVPWLGGILFSENANLTIHLSSMNVSFPQNGVMASVYRNKDHVSFINSATPAGALHTSRLTIHARCVALPSGVATSVSNFTVSDTKSVDLYLNNSRCMEEDFIAFPQRCGPEPTRCQSGIVNLSSVYPAAASGLSALYVGLDDLILRGEDSSWTVFQRRPLAVQTTMKWETPFCEGCLCHSHQQVIGARPLLHEFYCWVGDDFNGWIDVGKRPKTRTREWMMTPDEDVDDGRRSLTMTTQVLHSTVSSLQPRNTTQQPIASLATKDTPPPTFPRHDQNNASSSNVSTTTVPLSGIPPSSTTAPLIYHHRSHTATLNLTANDSSSLRLVPSLSAASADTSSALHTQQSVVFAAASVSAGSPTATTELQTLSLVAGSNCFRGGVASSTSTHLRTSDTRDERTSRLIIPFRIGASAASGGILAIFLINGLALGVHGLVLLLVRFIKFNKPEDHPAWLRSCIMARFPGFSVAIVFSLSVQGLTLEAFRNLLGDEQEDGSAVVATDVDGLAKVLSLFALIYVTALSAFPAVSALRHWMRPDYVSYVPMYVQRDVNSIVATAVLPDGFWRETVGVVTTATRTSGKETGKMEDMTQAENEEGIQQEQTQPEDAASLSSPLPRDLQPFSMVANFFSKARDRVGLYLLVLTWLRKALLSFLAVAPLTRCENRLGGFLGVYVVSVVLNICFRPYRVSLANTVLATGDLICAGGIAVRLFGGVARNGTAIHVLTFAGSWMGAAGIVLLGLKVFEVRRVRRWYNEEVDRLAHESNPMTSGERLQVDPTTTAPPQADPSAEAVAVGSLASLNPLAQCTSKQNNDPVSLLQMPLLTTPATAAQPNKTQLRSI